MKTLVLSDYDVFSQFIKEALSELQPYSTDDHSWYKGKFYTKELYLAEKYENVNFSTLLDKLITDGSIKNVISIGLGIGLTPNLKQGDILINDYPSGSCQELMDRFLNFHLDGEEKPLRIFVGNIFNESPKEETLPGLACLDSSPEELFNTCKAKGLSTLAVRIITGEENKEQLDGDTINNVIPKLLLLLKQTIEKVN